ncbi:MAG TPA: hypothetical protein VLI90_13380 [Tepidisphaeraceae bacterium]|nr:hypothetical protein [Tepidisphaeraceae bacterium]
MGSAVSNLGYGGSGSIVNSGSVQFENYPLASSGDGTNFTTNSAISSTYHNISPISFGILNGVPSNNNYEPIQVSLAYDGLAHTLTESLLGLTTGGTFSFPYASVDFNTLLGGNSVTPGSPVAPVERRRCRRSATSSSAATTGRRRTSPVRSSRPRGGLRPFSRASCPATTRPAWAG